MIRGTRDRLGCAAIFCPIALLQSQLSFLNRDQASLRDLVSPRQPILWIEDLRIQRLEPGSRNVSLHRR